MYDIPMQVFHKCPLIRSKSSFKIFLFTIIHISSFLQGIEMKERGRRFSQGSQMSVEGALINVAKSQISTSMSKLNQNEVCGSFNSIWNYFCHWLEGLHYSYPDQFGAFFI